jgi:CRP-like cAMP-binding protein
MPPAALYDLISHARFEHIEGENGDIESLREIRPNELWVILEGDLHFSSDASELGRGNFFGEMALLDLALAQETDTLGVYSKSGCTCLVLSSADLRGWLQRHTQLEALLYRHLSQELFNRGVGQLNLNSISGIGRRVAS